MHQVLEAEASASQELVDAGGVGQVTARVDSTPLAGEAVLVRGVAQGRLAGDCGRCLENLEQPFEVRFNLLLEKRTASGLEWGEEAEDAGVEDYRALLGPDVTDISLDHMIAEQVLLNYNLHPLPALDAQQRCVQCGKLAPGAVETRKADRVDPRWSRLKSLRDSGGETGLRPPEAS